MTAAHGGDRLTAVERDVEHLQGEVSGLREAKHLHANGIQTLNVKVATMDDKVQQIPALLEQIANWRGSLKVALGVVAFTAAVVSPVLTAILIKIMGH